MYMYKLGEKCNLEKWECTRAGTQPQLSWNTPTLLSTHLSGTSPHAQTLKWAWQQSFNGRNLASNAQQTNEGSNLQTFFPILECT